MGIRYVSLHAKVYDVKMLKFIGWFDLFKLENVNVQLLLLEDYFRIDVVYNEFDWKVIQMGLIPGKV